MEKTKRLLGVMFGNLGGCSCVTDEMSSSLVLVSSALVRKEGFKRGCLKEPRHS